MPPLDDDVDWTPDQESHIIEFESPETVQPPTHPENQNEDRVLRRGTRHRAPPIYMDVGLQVL